VSTTKPAATTFEEPVSTTAAVAVTENLINLLIAGPLTLGNPVFSGPAGELVFLRAIADYKPLAVPALLLIY
jgi:hypothetical protein